MMLAKELNVTPERALDVFYATDVCRQLSDPKTGLQLMSDGYVVEDILSELVKLPIADVRSKDLVGVVR